MSNTSLQPPTIPRFFFLFLVISVSGSGQQQRINYFILSLNYGALLACTGWCVGIL